MNRHFSKQSQPILLAQAHVYLKRGHFAAAKSIISHCQKTKPNCHELKTAYQRIVVAQQNKQQVSFREISAINPV